MLFQIPASGALAATRHRLHLPSVAPTSRLDGEHPYRDKLLQAALRKDAVELWPKRPLCENGEHDALEHHGLSPLKETATTQPLLVLPVCFRMSSFIESHTNAAIGHYHHHHHHPHFKYEETEVNRSPNLQDPHLQASYYIGET